MTRFNMEDALTFVSVVEEGNFVLGAKVHGINASVVSKRISRLEKDLKIQLFSRTTRNMTITEAGQLFYERCKRIQGEIDGASNALAAHQVKAEGLLRINSPTSFGQVHLMPMISKFLTVYPDISIELLLGSQFSSFIYDGLDMAIFINDLPDTHLLKSKRITLRQTGIYASPEYLKKHSCPRTPDDLKNHNCLVYQLEPGKKVGLGQKQNWTFYKNHQAFKTPVSGNLKANNNQALVSAALAGLGIVKLSSFMVTMALKKGKLVSILEDYCEKNIAIHLAYPNGSFLPFKSKVFIDFLVEWFKREE